MSDLFVIVKCEDGLPYIGDGEPFTTRAEAEGVAEEMRNAADRDETGATYAVYRLVEVPRD